MVSLQPGMLTKMLELMGSNVRVAGEHRSVLLQIIGIVPALAGQELWPTLGFHVRVSDATHSMYVTLSSDNDDSELILSGELQLGQFVYAERLQVGSPFPRLVGIRSAPVKASMSPEDLAARVQPIPQKSLVQVLAMASACGVKKASDTRNTSGGRRLLAGNGIVSKWESSPAVNSVRQPTDAHKFRASSCKKLSLVSSSENRRPELAHFGKSTGISRDSSRPVLKARTACNTVALRDDYLRRSKAFLFEKTPVKTQPRRSSEVGDPSTNALPAVVFSDGNAGTKTLSTTRMRGNVSERETRAPSPGRNMGGGSRNVIRRSYTAIRAAPPNSVAANTSARAFPAVVVSCVDVKSEAKSMSLRASGTVYAAGRKAPSPSRSLVPRNVPKQSPIGSKATTATQMQVVSSALTKSSRKSWDVVHRSVDSVAAAAAAKISSDASAPRGEGASLIGNRKPVGVQGRRDARKPSVEAPTRFSKHPRNEEAKGGSLSGAKATANSHSPIIHDGRRTDSIRNSRDSLVPSLTAPAKGMANIRKSACSTASHAVRQASAAVTILRNVSAFAELRSASRPESPWEAMGKYFDFVASLKSAVAGLPCGGEEKLEGAASRMYAAAGLSADVAEVRRKKGRGSNNGGGGGGGGENVLGPIGVNQVGDVVRRTRTTQEASSKGSTTMMCSIRKKEGSRMKTNASNDKAAETETETPAMSGRDGTELVEASVCAARGLERESEEWFLDYLGKALDGGFFFPFLPACNNNMFMNMEGGGGRRRGNNGLEQEEEEEEIVRNLKQLNEWMGQQLEYDKLDERKQVVVQKLKRTICDFLLLNNNHMMLLLLGGSRQAPPPQMKEEDHGRRRRMRMDAQSQIPSN